MQRPIPVWLGAMAEPALRRVGRIADGWFPLTGPGPRLDAALATVRTPPPRRGATPAPSASKAESSAGDAEPAAIAEQAAAWREAGATHLGVDTMRAGLETTQEHIAALTAAAGVLLR